MFILTTFIMFNNKINISGRIAKIITTDKPTIEYLDSKNFNQIMIGWFTLINLFVYFMHFWSEPVMKIINGCYI